MLEGEERATALAGRKGGSDKKRRKGFDEGSRGARRGRDHAGEMKEKGGKRLCTC